MNFCLDLCQLCHQYRRLENSHIIPRFIEKWIKQVSQLPTFVRCNDFNIDLQRAYVEHFLCAECEDRFAKAESSFAKHVFHPWIKNGNRYSGNDAWLCYFLTSLTWRVARWLELRQTILTNGSMHLSAPEIDALRLYLLEQSSRPGAFAPKLFFNTIKECAETDEGATSSPTPLFDYLARHLDLILRTSSDQSQVEVYIKIPYFVIWQKLKAHGFYSIETETTLRDLCSERAEVIANEMRCKISQESRERRRKLIEKRFEGHSLIDYYRTSIGDGVRRAQEYLQ